MEILRSKLVVHQKKMASDLEAKKAADSVVQVLNFELEKMKADLAAEVNTFCCR